ncbi:hypothetical protein ACWGLF_41660 [Streptomyces puniciscabiei]
MAALLTGSLGSITTAQATTPTTHCVANVQTHASKCFSDFRDAISYATGGRVTDAPHDPHTAATSTTFQAEINQPSTTASKKSSSGHTMAANAVVDIGTIYSNPDWTGNTLTFNGTGPCQDLRNVSNFGFPDLSTIPYPGGNWWGKTRSWQGENGCAINGYASANYDYSTGWTEASVHGSISGFLMSILSLQFWGLPSDSTLSSLCSTYLSTCDMTPQGSTAAEQASQSVVLLDGYDCGPFQQGPNHYTQTYSDATQVMFGTFVTEEAEVDAIVAKVKTSVQLQFQYTMTSTYTKTFDITFTNYPHSYNVVYAVPTVYNVTGTATLHLPESSYSHTNGPKGLYDGSSWFTFPFTITGANGAAITTTGHTLTDPKEIAAHCPGGTLQYGPNATVAPPTVHKPGNAKIHPPAGSVYQLPIATAPLPVPVHTGTGSKG